MPFNRLYCEIATVTLSCVVGFFLGREYEKNKLRKTYISKISYNQETGETVEKRFYYR